MSKKNFYRNSHKILSEFEQLVSSDDKYAHFTCINNLINDFKSKKIGCLSNAYYWINVEMDKIRMTPFIDILLKYKVVESNEKFITRNKWLRKKSGKNYYSTQN